MDIFGCKLIEEVYNPCINTYICRHAQGRSALKNPHLEAQAYQ